MAKLAERKKELRRSESGKVLKKKNLRNLGVVVYLIGMFLWFQNGFSDYYYFYTLGYVLAGIFIVTGLTMVYRATRFNILVEQYNDYYYWIYQNEIFTVSEIEAKTKKTEKRVIKELSILIDEGFLKNIHVNLDDKTIEGAFVTSVKEQILRKVIRCSGCGARNEVVEHETRECEYCGRKLVYEDDLN